jgi:hypothetical protein
VSGRLKRRTNALPTPASVPRAVNENIIRFVIFHEGLAFPYRLFPLHSTKHLNEPFIPNILAGFALAFRLNAE